MLLDTFANTRKYIWIWQHLLQQRPSTVYNLRFNGLLSLTKKRSPVTSQWELNTWCLSSATSLFPPHSPSAAITHLFHASLRFGQSHRHKHSWATRVFVTQSFKAVFRVNQPFLFQKLTWSVFSILRGYDDSELASFQSLNYAKPQLSRHFNTP